MTKVCVVTIYKHNYGAFLQAYALQRYLEKIGYEASVLDYDYFKDHAILGISVKKVKNPVTFAKSLIYRTLRYGVSKERDRILEKCAKETMIQTQYYKTYEAVKKEPPEADIFITGSDQVWNPTISEQGFLSRLLEFAPNDHLVICSYAASVGVKAFSDEVRKLVMDNLNRYDCISVREPASADVIRDLTDKEILFHKDPALLLTSEQWDLFAEKIESKKPYLFIYLAQKDPDLVKYAVELAKEKGWDIVDCHGSVNYHIENCINGKRIFSPREFVGGIKNATYVVTNSFHCLVFSIHYKKRAYVKMPPKGSGRLSELIENMSLDRITQPQFIKEEEVNDIYSKTNSYLETERKKSQEYLRGLKTILEAKRG